MIARTCKYLAALVVAASSTFAGCSSGGSLEPLPERRGREPGTQFAVGVERRVGDGPWALAVADFDTNGAPDVAVANMLDRSISVISNDVDGTIFDGNASSRDTVLQVDSLLSSGSDFRPRTINAADVNGDGLPDLVISFMGNDTVENSIDRVVVLLNRGAPRAARCDSVVLDTLAGEDIRDVFVGDLDPNDGDVEIVAAPSSPNTPPVVLSRNARTADSRDSTINLVGKEPEPDAESVALSAPIKVWYDIKVKNADLFLDPARCRVTGRLPGGEPREIPIANVTQKAVRIDYASYTQYWLWPEGGFFPEERITVRLDSIQSEQSRPDNPILAEYEEWSFTTDGTRILETDPPAGSKDIGIRERIDLKLNFGIDPNSLSTDNVILLNSRDQVVDRSVTYEPLTRTVTVSPTEGYDPYDELELRVKPRPFPILDSLGNDTFIGDTLFYTVTGPMVAWTTPRNGVVARLEDVSILAQSVVIRFNTEVEPPEGDELVVIGAQSGRHEIEEVGYTAGRRNEVYAFVSGRFAAGERVTLTATSRFRSREGLVVPSYPLAKPHVWQFLVRPNEGPSYSGGAPLFDLDPSGGAVSGGRLMPADDGFGVLFPDPGGAFQALLRRDDGWQSTDVTLAASPGRYIIRAADVNGDGLQDVVVARSDSIECLVYINATDSSSSAPAFSEPSAYEVGEEPSGLFIADLNGDGFLDLATSNLLSNDVSVLLNKGDGTFEDERFYPVGDHPQAIDGADFDGDGDIDLVVANSTEGSVTILRNLLGRRPAP